MARLMPELIETGGASILTLDPKLTAILLVASQQAVGSSGGNPPPTTGQLWPRGNS